MIESSGAKESSRVMEVRFLKVWKWRGKCTIYIILFEYDFMISSSAGTPEIDNAQSIASIFIGFERSTYLTSGTNN